jgi:hypothetical protein
VKLLLCTWICLAMMTACTTDGRVQSPSGKTAAHPLKIDRATPGGSNSGNAICYQMGYRWGVCTAENTAGFHCNPETDAVIPSECMNRPETRQGIKDGLRATQSRLQ